MVWSQLALLTVYVHHQLHNRFSLCEIEKFRRIEFLKWTNGLGEEKKAEKERDIEINLVIIAANNHYVGFGLLTTNIFRKIVGPLKLS